jgi:hypothetical protein
LVLDESPFSQPTGLVREKREPRHSRVLPEGLVSFYATVIRHDDRTRGVRLAVQ